MRIATSITLVCAVKSRRKNLLLIGFAKSTPRRRSFRWKIISRRSRKVLRTPHLAESREEMSMFHDASGPLYEFLRSVGRDMSDCEHGTPFALFTRIVRAPAGRALPTEWIVAHLNELAESDFELLEGSARKFHVVHSPRSHDYF